MVTKDQTGVMKTPPLAPALSAEKQSRRPRRYPTRSDRSTNFAIPTNLSARHALTSAPRPFAAAPSNGEKKLRVAVLGGLEEIGRNCTLIEYGDDIILIDMGLQFPEEDMPGIDYIIPNMSYLEGKEKNIRGVIITHGHYAYLCLADHDRDYQKAPRRFQRCEALDDP
jgi:hypothetical protein